MPKTKARFIVESYGPWCTDTTAAEISTAFGIEDEANISFWDALIVASALKRGADLNAGPRIAGIVIENPFVLQ